MKRYPFFKSPTVPFWGRLTTQDKSAYQRGHPLCHNPTIGHLIHLVIINYVWQSSFRLFPPSPPLSLLPGYLQPFVCSKRQMSLSFTPWSSLILHELAGPFHLIDWSETCHGRCSERLQADDHECGEFCLSKLGMAWHEMTLLISHVLSLSSLNGQRAYRTKMPFLDKPFLVEAITTIPHCRRKSWQCTRSVRDSSDVSRNCGRRRRSW